MRYREGGAASIGTGRAGAVTEVYMSEDGGLDQGVDSWGGSKGWISQMFGRSHPLELLQIDWAWGGRARKEFDMKSMPLS